MKNNILITGSNGFIGKHLCNLLSKDLNINLWILKTKKNKKKIKYNYIEIEDLKSNFDITEKLKKIDCIIHLAALAHNKYKKNEIFEVNVNSVIRLANQASQAKVKKFIFLSTIKVYGEFSTNNIIFNEESPTYPQTIYAKAKLEAEKYLLDLSKISDLKITIIRSPLVYGKNAKANLKKLYFFIENKIPIPRINQLNFRSFIAIDNLTDFISTCIYSKHSSNKIFCISDEEKISVYKFFDLISSSLNKKINYFYINNNILYFIFYIFGKKRIYHSLFSSLRVSIDKAKLELNWKPIITTETAIQKYLGK